MAKPKVEKEKEMPDTSELSNVTVVDNLSEYVRMYLDTVYQEDDSDVTLMVVDGDKPVNNKTYLTLGREAKLETKRPYVFISSTGTRSIEQLSRSVEHMALRTYLASLGIRVTYDAKELAGWLR